MSILADHTSIPAQRAVEHPSWCDPLHCTTYPDTDAETLVTHRAVLLDEQLPFGRMRVEVIRGDIVCRHGGELIDQGPAVVRVAGVYELTELRPEQAGRLAAAVTRAAELASGGAR